MDNAKEIKRWTLLKNSFEEADYIWLRNNADAVQINHKYKEVGYRQIKQHYYLDSEVILQTSKEEQEAMLKLKYDSQLVLLSVIFLEPGEMYQDHFGSVIYENI